MYDNNNSTKLHSWVDSMQSQKLVDTFSCLDYDHQIRGDVVNTAALDRIVQYRLELSPSDAFARDFCGRTCLYLALKHHLPPASIKLLYKANRSALITPDFCGISPIALLFFDSCPIEMLKEILVLCPETFALHKTNSGKSILEELTNSWTIKIQNKGITPFQVRRDPKLMLQWEKIICTAMSVRETVVGSKNNCIMQTGAEERNAELSFAPESQAIIDMSMTGKLKLSPDLILFALKFYHTSNEKIGNPARLINILSNYEPREDCDEKGDETLEAIVLYRLSICPSEALQFDQYGRTTLYHLTKSNPTARSIKNLIVADPNALVTPDFCGISPIAIAFLDISPLRILKIFLELQPEVVFQRRRKSFSSQSVLDELNITWTRLITTKAISVSLLKSNPSLMDQWQKFMATVQVASYIFAEKEKDESFAFRHDQFSFAELHASLQLWNYNKLPIAIFSFVMEMYSDQLKMGMDTDESSTSIPLHYLIRNCAASKDSEIDIDGGEDEVRGDFLHVLQTMLKLYPEGARVKHYEDGRHSLALHMALRSNMKFHEGISDLIAAFPRSIYIRENKSNLAPFMTAAVGPDSSLDAIMTVLLEGPSMINF